MFLYNNVAELRQFHGGTFTAVADQHQHGNGRSNAAKDLYLEVANFFAQCVAIDTQQVGRPDLVSARGCERHR
jgi:hypothetical protein